MKLFLFAIITFNFLTLSNANEPKERFACKTNSDCVLTEDFCHWRAINKKFEKLFKEDGRASPYECSTPKPDPALKLKLKVNCVKSLCEAN